MSTHGRCRSCPHRSPHRLHSLAGGGNRRTRATASRMRPTAAKTSPSQRRAASGAWLTCARKRGRGARRGRLVGDLLGRLRLAPKLAILRPTATPTVLTELPIGLTVRSGLNANSAGLAVDHQPTHPVTFRRSVGVAVSTRPGPATRTHTDRDHRLT
jgi:hypothetical protein